MSICCCCEHNSSASLSCNLVHACANAATTRYRLLERRRLPAEAVVAWAVRTVSMKGLRGKRGKRGKRALHSKRRGRPSRVDS